MKAQTQEETPRDGRGRDWGGIYVHRNARISGNSGASEEARGILPAISAAPEPC